MKREKIYLIAILIILPLVLFLSLTNGTSKVGIKEISNMIFPFFFDKPVSDTAKDIIFYLRFPRTMIAFLVGGNLAIAGAIMQGFFKNPMAEPYIVGVSSGAGLGAVVAEALGLASLSIFFTPAIAFTFALAVTFLVYMISLKNGRSDTNTLLLAGIAMTSFIGSITYFILYIIIDDWNKGKSVLYWMMGGLEGKSIEQLLMVLPMTVIGLVLSFSLPRVLNVMSLGEEHSVSLGIDMKIFPPLIIATSAVLTASAVSVSGMIGFVGLIIPHITRLLTGPNHKTLLPYSFLTGGIFLLFIDVFIRNLSPYINLRLGIVTGLLGAPFFIFLLLKHKKGVFR